MSPDRQAIASEPRHGTPLFDSVLVTGCRFEIGQGLCRLLKATGSARRVIGSDSTEDHPGPLLFDGLERTPAPGDPSYFPFLEGVIARHGIDLVIPMSEAEIYAFATAGFATSFKDTPVLAPNEGAISVGKDKLETMAFLPRFGIPHPWTLPVSGYDPVELPCIIKPRQGNEGHMVEVVDDPARIPSLRQRRPDHIWQELLKPKEEELTCGLFRSRTGEIRAIGLRRRLQGGYTSAGEVVYDRGTEEYLARIARAIRLRGSINVQLRRTEEGPMAFEINPRFSSTVVFRHILGFRDFLWSMQDLTGACLDPYFPPAVGTRFYRGPRELVLHPTDRGFQAISIP